MLLNKWIQFGMSAIIAGTGFMSAVDWTAVFSQKTAAGIAGAVGVIKMVTNAIAPAAGVSAEATGSSIVTHN